MTESAEPGVGNAGFSRSLASDAMEVACPDLIITNYSMLECMNPIRCAENLRALAKVFKLIASKKTRVA